MSQLPSMDELVEHLAESTEYTSRLMHQLISREYKGDLTPASSEIAKRLVKKDGDIIHLRKRSLETKRLLEEAVPKRKRANTGEGGTRTKPLLASALFDKLSVHDAEIMEEIETAAVEQVRDIGDFLTKLAAHKAANSSEAAAYGLLLLVRGVGSATTDEIGMNDNAVLDTSFKMISGDMDKFNAYEMADWYLSSEEGAFQQGTFATIFQNLFHVLGVLRYLKRWRKLNLDATPNLAKQAVLVAAYRRKMGIDPGVLITRNEDGFIKFNNQHRTFVRGAGRLADAYDKLGPLVLVCHHLGFVEFRNGETGKVLQALLKKLPDKIPKDRDTQMDVLDKIVSLYPDNSLKKLVADVIKDIELLEPDEAADEVGELEDGVISGIDNQG